LNTKPVSKAAKSRKPPSAATIYDIAARTGVSKSTVSRVLTNNKRVDPATRTLVLEAMRDLGFSPSAAARILSTRSEARIGLVYSNPSVAYFAELLMGALEGSSRNGAHLVVDRCEAVDPEVAYESVRNLVRDGIAGMILPTPLSEHGELIRELTEKGIAVVGVGTSGVRNDVTCVDVDDYTAAHEMTKYLLGLGHRDIGFVKGHPALPSSKNRILGVKAAVKDAGDRAARLVFVQGYNTYRSGIDAADRILSKGSKVTAIFASNDDMAAGVMSMVHRKGLDVPRDVSVVGFDDTIAGIVWPELTTIRQPISEIGATAIDLIIENIRLIRAGSKPNIQNRVIQHTLIVRESAAPPRVEVQGPSRGVRAVYRRLKPHPQQ
jgi:LacI family transcriptional regulator